jgi:hypothetical protein
MKERCPPTGSEFLAHGRSVVVRCHCGRGLSPVTLRPEGIVQRLGPEFDLYARFPELRRSFPCTKESVRNILNQHADPRSTLFTDESRLFTETGKGFAFHPTVTHSAGEYARGGVHTNTIENVSR